MSAPEVDLVVCCNGATTPRWAPDSRTLEYQPRADDQNVRIGLPDFVQDVYHIPHRTLDLLELAGYIFAADRLKYRGNKDQVEYHSWARRWLFRMKVRDRGFWADDEVRALLQRALKFMTGDADYQFNFLAGHSTPPASLFDVEGFQIEPEGRPVRVSLFSGGLDSLAGALTLLERSEDHVVLVSHESQTGTMRTQRALIKALEDRYSGRVSHYGFRCHLKGDRAAEETQRTRSLLYSSIGFAIAQAYGCDSLDVHENGVTSVNLHRREDLMNARASRTTHPRSMWLLSKLFSLMGDKPFSVRLPFLWKTKCDVIAAIEEMGHADLIASAVSCSRTFQREGNATHCGRCFQCVDRRIAVHSAGLEAHDDRGLYSTDVFQESIQDREARTTAVDYIRQASWIAEANIDRFGAKYLVELGETTEAIDEPTDEFEKVEALWGLMSRHAEHVRLGLLRARHLYDDIFKALQPGSLLELVASREHRREEVHRSVDTILERLAEPLAEILSDRRPKNESELNTLVGGILRSHDPSVRSEHPTVSFALARVIPDHEVPGVDLLLEAKYIREGTPPSRASEGMAADLTKYPPSSHILFLVYDPDRAISSDRTFVSDFESRGQCTVQIIR